MSDFSNIFEGINADNASAPSFDNSPIAPGEYHLSVVDASVRESKTGNPYISVQYRIEDGQPGANRRIFEIYMLGGNKTAVEIAKKGLSVLAKAAGHSGDLTNPSQLIGGHLWGEVVVEPGRDGYDDKNRVRWVNAYAGQDAEKSSSDGGSNFDAF
jgi:hypothetical protein